MMEASQGLFDEQKFIIIPNGISDDQLDEVCDASGTEGSSTNANISCADKLSLRTEASSPSIPPWAASIA